MQQSPPAGNNKQHSKTTTNSHIPPILTLSHSHIHPIYHIYHIHPISPFIPFSMLNIFSSRPTDVKGIRHAILQLIKEQLQKAEGGEGGIIRSLQLYLTCSDAEKHVYESAVYAGLEPKFQQEEVQRIADDYAIDLPPGWQFETIFDEAPPQAIRAQNISAALLVVTNKTRLRREPATAYLKVLHGDTAETLYTIRSGKAKYNIGREEKVQAADGFFRTNFIAFKGDSSHPANRSVSRQHAHIEWDEENGAFYLYADEGGIPPGNKLKVRSENGEPWKLQTTQIGYRLQEGDQMIFGESAVLEFSYHNN